MLSIAERLESTVSGRSTKPFKAEDPPAHPGYDAVTVVNQPVKVTRNLTLTIVGVSVTVSLVIDGILHLVLG